ncbi:hypothetical protein QAD02_008553 [Eretmocerus hayati]|uniref:Uncharacterized protein n=1 Tax=Eretmocerus hayati TaxID=131215 RepID=A0ACC2N735_9HYME|nr:hypothetical protein QAD02_008553 [Eretmocerus hayati]
MFVVDDAQSSLRKPFVAFKLRGGPLKIKGILQQSAKRVFDDLVVSPNTSSSKLFIPSEENIDEPSAVLDKNEHSVCPYTEPSWSCLPKHMYRLDVLKSGTIMNTFYLLSKNSYSIGNSPSSDIPVNHETISQFHAVLQYGKMINSEDEEGFYIYDLQSEHGTYLNDHQVQPHTYVSLGGGHILSFGRSQKKYVLVTSRKNQEEYDDISAEELQPLRELEWEEQQQIDHKTCSETKYPSIGDRTEGINWGIKEDLDNCTRLMHTSDESEDANEELYINDPKKALREWFKWEGHDLEYYTEDRGYGRYSCSIDLTLDAVGTTETVEILIKGSKEKAIDECALSACQFLHKFGLLKKALEEKRSTTRNWKEVDYYDSDDDNFLDRTGVIEKKRHQRMNVTDKSSAEVDIHNELVAKYIEVTQRIKHLEESITQQSNKQKETNDLEEDTLDAFMTKLDSSTLNKTELLNIKIELKNLYQEKKLLQNTIDVNRLASGSSSKAKLNITEKTKNRCRFDDC